jgi:mono/diheme cytochrome c family protein
MSGQNTRKQIIAMVALMAIGIAAMLVYVWFDDGRRAEAEDHQSVEAAERGASLFANNCRICHGNTGLGRDGHPSLIGPSLNNPNNTLAFRTDNTGALQGIQGNLSATIACGRNGTPMPPWAIDQGGSLNFFKIENLVALITTNAGNGWDYALERALEQDETILGSLETAVRDAEASGDATRLEEAETALAVAQSRFADGLPVAVAIPSITKNTCGQITADDGAGASAAPVDVDEIDTSAFAADAAHGEELFFANGCNICHGDTGGGIIGPQIAGTTLTFSQVVDQYRSPRGTMPAFSADNVPDQDVFDIFAWLQTLDAG